MADVLIVGASLAGSAAAIHLARRGYAVEILEQSTFPRRKACGEGLFSGGIHELRDLGVLEDVSPQSAAIASMRFRLGDVAVEAPLPQATEAHLGIRRDLLDERLVIAAIEAGASVRTGVQVRRAIQRPGGFVLETTAGLHDARVIIGADGANSRLRLDAGLQAHGRPRRFGISAHMRPRHAPPARIEIVFAEEHELYLTPVGQGVINVALLFGRPASLTFKGNLRGRLLELCNLSGIEGELLDEPLMSGPFPSRARAIWKDNLVLTGDAAGFYDPITGEGMSMALKSARLCAEAVERYLEHDAGALERYGRRHRALVRNPVLLARLMLFLAAHPILGRRAIVNLGRHPETLTKLIAINNGSVGFGDLRPRDLTALTVGR